jgi:hypothetical protein
VCVGNREILAVHYRQLKHEAADEWGLVINEDVEIKPALAMEVVLARLELRAYGPNVQGRRAELAFASWSRRAREKHGQNRAGHTGTSEEAGPCRVSKCAHRQDSALAD